ncbi:uncharacterized protein DC041_0001732 [Schistosoma bovis]|uniref:Phospholipid scramblase n=2 Tax=Schistosoma TaxID=6181 RepID=A0A430QN61_SCHBO|nr:uncharacterized protein DC041_0001732 [Schistosoma bovis]
MWMQRPAVINCPPGLEYLTQIDQLLIKQVIDAIESECCQEELEVQSPAGNCIGYVKRVFSGCNLDYHILDSNQSTVLQIHGPSCCFCECLGSDIIFKVTSADGTVEIGRITRKWSNIVQEFFTDADNFGVSFPMDLDVKVKAILLAAVFLIVSYTC